MDQGKSIMRYSQDGVYDKDSIKSGEGPAAKNRPVFVGIPKTLALAYGLEKGDDLEWVITDPGLSLKKV